MLEILEDSTVGAEDAVLVALLERVYVGGGFTSPVVAATVFTPQAIRGRGQLLWARVDGTRLAGTVVVVSHDSAARKFASTSEAELHLLAVDSECRGQGIGQALVRAAIETARRMSCTGLILWTQPSMHAARRVYEQCGFRRSAAEDFVRDGRVFHVYRLQFDAGR